MWSDENDDSFKEYIKTVYGEYPRNISFKYQFDYLYSRSDIEFMWQNPYRLTTNTDMRFGTYHMYLDLHSSEHLFAFRDRRKKIVPGEDYEWIEVTRGRTDCLVYPYIPSDVDAEKKKTFLSGYFEGFSRGWPVVTTGEGFGTRKPKPYGCWFYIGRGTGMFINLGKTLVSMSRSQANEILGLTGQSDFYDFDICSKVIEKGYDSIQMYNNLPPRDLPELVYCTGRCATDEVRSACPPVELRTGWNATKRCDCNDTYPIMNCNNKITDIMDCFNIKEPQYRSKHTCYFEDFNWVSTFQTDWDGSIAIFILWDRNGIQSLPKLKTVMSIHRQGGWNTIVVASGMELLDHAANHTFILDTMNYVGYDVVPILQKSEHAFLSKSKYAFHMLSLTVPGFLRSTVVKRAGVKIGFISYSLHSMSSDDVDLLAQLVLDEVKCLKRLADIVVLLSASKVFVDSYISKKVGKYVDMIIGGNGQEALSCNDNWHTSNENVIVHSRRDGSYITKISIDVVSRSTYAFKSDILDTSDIKEDNDVKRIITKK